MCIKRALWKHGYWLPTSYMGRPQVKGHRALFTQFELHTWCFFFLLTHLMLQTFSSHVLKGFCTHTSGLSRPPVTAAPSAVTDRDREVLFSPQPRLPVNAPATGSHNGGARFSVLPTPPSPPPCTHPNQPFSLCFQKSCFSAVNWTLISHVHQKKKKKKKASGRGQVREGY